MRTTIIGVDLATKAIQVCVYLNSKVLSNKELTLPQFSEFWGLRSNGTVLYAEGVNYLICKNILDSKNKEQNSGD